MLEQTCLLTFEYLHSGLNTEVQYTSSYTIQVYAHVQKSKYY